MTKILSLLKNIQSSPNVVRAEHTGWQAAAGAFVAAMSGTHGDVRSAIVVAVAAGLAAIHTMVFPSQVNPVVVTAADMVEVPRPTAPVDVVSTPSTPASVNVDPAP